MLASLPVPISTDPDRPPGVGAGTRLEQQVSGGADEVHQLGMGQGQAPFGRGRTSRCSSAGPLGHHRLQLGPLGGLLGLENASSATRCPAIKLRWRGSRCSTVRTGRGKSLSRAPRTSLMAASPPAEAAIRTMPYPSSAPGLLIQMSETDPTSLCSPPITSYRTSSYPHILPRRRRERAHPLTGRSKLNGGCDLPACTARALQQGPRDRGQSRSATVTSISTAPPRGSAATPTAKSTCGVRRRRTRRPARRWPRRPPPAAGGNRASRPRTRSP